MNKIRYHPDVWEISSRDDVLRLVDEVKKMKLIKVERVDEEFLKEVVKRIVSAVDPEKIILFGSYAYGMPKKESDLDLLVVVKESSLPRYKRSVPIYKALAGILIPKDIIVYTEKEIEEWSNVPLAFITTIIRKGKVIYEKQN